VAVAAPVRSAVPARAFSARTHPARRVVAQGSGAVANWRPEAAAEASTALVVAPDGSRDPLPADAELEVTDPEG
jgi:hypothetical protein